MGSRRRPATDANSDTTGTSTYGPSVLHIDSCFLWVTHGDENAPLAFSFLLPRCEHLPRDLRNRAGTDASPFHSHYHLGRIGRKQYNRSCSGNTLFRKSCGPTEQRCSRGRECASH